MPKISDLAALTSTDVSNPREINLLLSDLQGTPTSNSITADELAQISQHIVVDATSHGLVAGDVGKPLVGLELFDDLDFDAYPTWILVSVIDANTIVVAPLGALVDLPTTLLDTGNAYDPATDGYDVYYDASQGKYSATRPSGAAGGVGYLLSIVRVDSGTSRFIASVRASSKPEASNIFEVVGTNNSTVDDVSYAAALAKANAAGDGSAILLNGTVRLANNYTYTAAVSILGKKGTNPRLISQDTGGLHNWNGNYAPLSSGTSVSIPVTGAKQAWLAVAPGTLAAGDWFLAISDDTIEGVTHTEGPVSTSTQTVTANAASDIFTTSSAHGYTVGDTVTFTTSNTLPDGMTLTTYYIASTPTTNTFTISETDGGGVLDILDTGTGTLTVFRSCIADPVTDVITREGHGFRDNDAVILQTTGTMPGGLTENQTYWVVSKTTDTFKVAATRAGSAINITSAGTGALTARTIYANCPLEVHQCKEIRASAPTCAITSFASSVFTKNSHGYVNGHIVQFTTTGTLPTGLSADTPYYIINKTSNTFQVSLTEGGSAVSVTDATGSGTHTAEGYDYVVFDDYIYDALTINPRIIIMSDVFDGIELSGFSVGWGGSTTQAAPTFDLRKCVNVTIKDFHSEHDGPTSIMFLYCGNVICTEFKIENKKTYVDENGYNIVCGPVNRFIFSDSVAVGCRHVFTTEGQIYQGARYGTPRNVLVTNIVASMDGKYYSTLVPFDTHAEGWRVVFSNLAISVPYEPRTPDTSLSAKNSNRALQSRSRGTVFKSCVVEGNDLTIGAYLMGSDCRVEHSSFKDCWRGVVVRQDNSGAVTSGLERAVIAFNIFDDCRGPGVLCEYGTAHRVNHNDFNNCGQYADAPVTKAVVYFDGGTDYVCCHNQMNRGSNTLAIGGANVAASDFLYVTNNSMVGYTGVSGATDSGFDSTNPDAIALQALADAYNTTD